jgi:glycosyltransferase involved in cell wall biosynthesis
MKIVIWTGPAWETWGPESLKTGLGGSEIAAIHMSAELARWGHEVSVVGQVTPGRHDDVEYLDYRQFLTPANIECDVFVSSRNLNALRELKPRTKISALWCHDIHVGDDWQGHMREYDLILCLSEWSRKVLSAYYSSVPKNKFVVTRNGIDIRLFLREPKKEGCKIVYSSSPDRGLDQLLNYWPKIREMRPDAELHVYYGFDTWQQMAVLRKDKNAQARIDFFRERLSQMQDRGVFSHGRVGQVELAKAWLSASMWLYPTNFLETSCLTAMEAQAAGALTIATKLAALAETVKYGILVDPSNSESRYEQEFLGHVQSFLNGNDFISTDHMLIAGREWALRSLSWTQVAEQWEEMFAEAIGNKHA